MQGAADEWTTAKLYTGVCMNRTEMPQKTRNRRQHSSARRGWWSCTALLGLLVLSKKSVDSVCAIS